ncbi:MAG: hypothetical protein VSS75_030550, partial [Candidatus Parabeggiatoa sp.]|nr:hypothetical protein [Candidatus Parabeggiatoa sp.]
MPDKAFKPLQKQGKHPHFEPNNLPFSIPDGKKVRPLVEDEKELKKLFSVEVAPIKVATTTLLPEMLTVAAAPAASYLQPTTDVQITPEIPSLSYTLSLPALNSQRLGVTYEPATESDAQALEFFQATDTGTLPAY